MDTDEHGGEAEAESAQAARAEQQGAIHRMAAEYPLPGISTPVLKNS
jgi:hypothetical protein